MYPINFLTQFHQSIFKLVHKENTSQQWQVGTETFFSIKLKLCKMFSGPMGKSNNLHKCKAWHKVKPRAQFQGFVLDHSNHNKEMDLGSVTKFRIIKIHHLFLLLILIIPLKDGILSVDSLLQLVNIKHLLRMYTLFKFKARISWCQEDGIAWSNFGKLMEIN